MIPGRMCIRDNKLADMSGLPIYPIFYFQRGNDCDLKFILVRMRNIPPDKQREVAAEYERIFQSGTEGRRLANTYLHKTASEYRDKRNGKQEEKMQRVRRLLQR